MYSWSKKSILISDDDPNSRVMLREFLKSTGIQIHISYNGQMAFEECIRNTAIDVVIMDVRMPVMDGLESARLIKKYRPELPIIIYTAINDPEVRFLIRKIRCEDFVLKPSSSHLILGVLSKYLDEQPQTTTADKYFWS